MITVIDGTPIKDKLYHGTPDYFQRVNLNMGKERKDFGKGFYLSYEKSHSRDIALRNMRLKKVSIGYLYTYSVNIEELTNLVKTGSVKYFPTADISWFDFVLKSRSCSHTWHTYSIVIGPTADDNTKVQFNLYRQGVYGLVGSDQAKLLMISNLHPENLGVQLFIANPNGLSILNEKTRVVERLRR